MKIFFQVVTAAKGAHVNVKLADFGTSRMDIRQKFSINVTAMREDQTPRRALTKGVGTLVYSAPEILGIFYIFLLFFYFFYFFFFVSGVFTGV